MGGFLAGAAGGPVGAVVGGIISFIIPALFGGGGGQSIYAPTQIIKDKVFTVTLDNGEVDTFHVPPNSIYAYYTIDQMNQLIHFLGWLQAAALGGFEIISTIPGNAPPPTQTTSGDDNITVVNNISNNVDSAITDALGQVVGEVQSSEGQLADEITTNIGGIANQLGQFANSAFGQLGSTLGNIVNSIGSTLGNLLSSVASGIGSAIGALGNVIATAAQQIFGQFAELIQAIKENGVSAILPVLNLLVTEIQNIRNIYAAIQTDIHGGMQALILLPTQIATSLGSIDATLNRALQQLGIAQMPKVTTDVTLGNVPFPGDFVQNLSNTVNPGGGGDGVFSSVDALTALASPCVLPDIGLQLQQIKNSMANLPSWAQWVFTVGCNLIQATTIIATLFEKQAELGIQKANQLCPIKRLDPATAVQAWLRGYIDIGTLTNELLVQGYDSTHTTVLTQLSSQRLDVGTLLDSFYRNIIGDSDLAAGLKVLGFSPQQATILQAQALALPSLQDVLRWRNFAQIDDPTFTGILGRLRIDPDAQRFILNTYQTPETLELQTAMWGRLQASGNNYVPNSFSQPTPTEVNTAAQRENLTAGNARLAWLAHWALPSYATIIQSYFRNLRTLTDVQNAMTAENIPAEFFDELVKLQRPLIPFRSIPTYVKAGVMSTGDAILELSSHGFDPLHIQWIMNYVNKTTSAKAATVATGIDALSIASARSLFIDGAITQDQYVSVLEAHKYTPDLAVLQAQADLMAAHVKERKQTITDLIDEVAAGTVTVDDALTQLNQQGFSQVEIARFQKGVRTASKATVKLPSIADLKSFLKAGIITLDQYGQALQLLGWADPWLSYFVALETPPPTPAAP